MPMLHLSLATLSLLVAMTELPPNAPVPPVGAAPTAQAPEPPPDAAPTLPGTDPAVVAILDRLETADDDLVAFAADVHYVVTDDLTGDEIIRKGAVLYDTSTGARRIGILFDRRIVNRRLREERREYVFSGNWLAEVDWQEKLFIRRQIARPGETIDPLKLGEGPFPLPVGQERAEVLRRFEVSLVALPESGPLAKLADRGPIDGLRLVPRPGSPAARDFERADLYYDRATGLPVGVRVVKDEGDRIETARFDAMRRNPRLTAEELTRLSVERPPGEGWRIDIRPLEAAGAPAPAGGG